MKDDANETDAGARYQDTGATSIMSDEVFQYYKGLVGQVQIALPQRSSRALLVASSVHGEGATEIAVGLGLMLAAGMGRKTALIDCNPTHPDLHRRFGTARIGLNEAINGDLPLDRALINTTVPNLHVMPLGEHPGHFATRKQAELTKLIAALRERFDYVIIDSAPMGISPEATVLCDKVDAVILVVHHGKTRREIVKRTREIIERAGGHLLGIVLNKRTFPIPEFLYRRL
jgi:capsular exopolysaccharide synthesis family protein